MRERVRERERQRERERESEREREREILLFDGFYRLPIKFSTKSRSFGLIPFSKQKTSIIFDEIALNKQLVSPLLGSSVL